MSEHTPRSRHLTDQQRGQAGGRAGGLPQSLGAGEWDIFISYGRRDHQFATRLHTMTIRLSGFCRTPQTLPWKIRFARDSALEQAGFELVWGFSCQVVVLGFAESSLFGGVSR